MTDLDRLLRETLNDDHWSLQPPDDLLSAATTGARRLRTRRRALTATAIVTAFATLFAAQLAVRTSRAPDPQPVTTPFVLPEGVRASALTSDATSLYALAGDRVHRFDRTTGELTATSPDLPFTPETLGLTSTTLWATGQVDETRKAVLLPLSTLASGIEITIDVDEPSTAPYFTPDAVWSTLHGKLLRRDPTTGAVTARTPVGGCSSHIVAATATTAWLWCQGDGYTNTVHAIALPTGETRSERSLPTGWLTAVPGENDSLWTIVSPGTLPASTANSRFRNLSPSGAVLHSRTFTIPPSTLFTIGPRLWLADPTGSLSCHSLTDAQTLAGYRTPPLADPPSLTGDPHSLHLLTSEGRIQTLTGPDPCLT